MSTEPDKLQPTTRAEREGWRRDAEIIRSNAADGRALPEFAVQMHNRALRLIADLERSNALLRRAQTAVNRHVTPAFEIQLAEDIAKHLEADLVE